MPATRLRALATLVLPLAVLGVAALVVTGGGGGGRPNPSPPDRVALETQRARCMLLTADDLSGSAVPPSVPGDGSGPFHAAAAPCARNEPMIVDVERRRRAAARALVRVAPSVSGSSCAVIGQSDGEARSAMAVLTGPAFQSCFADAIRDMVLTGRRYTAVTVATAALPPLAVGDDSAGYRSTVEASGDGETVQLYVDYVFIRSARVLGALLDLAVETPFPDDERVRLASAMAGRMA